MGSKAVALGWPIASGTMNGVKPSPDNNIWRGIGNNCYCSFSTPGIGSGNRSQRLRSLHRSPQRFSEISIVYTVFDSQPASGDIKWAMPLNYQAGFEANPVLSLTGLAPRQKMLWEGAGFKRYDNAVWDANDWTVETDALPIAEILGRYIEAGELFGIHSGQVLDGLDTAAQMPRQRPLTNYIQRYTGYQNVSTDDVATDGLFTATSYGNPSNVRTGSIGGFGPVMMRIKVPRTFVSMFFQGDSITQDQKVGYSVAPILFDAQGDQNGNSSWATMAAKRMQVGAVNVSRGSDGDKNLITAAKWAGRLEVLRKSNATCYDNTNGMNDTAAATQSPANWSSGMALNKFDVFQAGGGRIYMCTKSGTASASAPTNTEVGKVIAEGTADIIYLGPRYAGDRDKAYTTFGWKCNVNAQVRAAMPLIYIRNMLPLLKATSTDNFANDTGTPVLGYGPNQSRTKMRELMNDARLREFLGANEIYDLSDAIETGPASMIVRTNGSSGFILDPDGTHPVDQGQQNMADRLPYPPQVSPAQLVATYT